MKKKIFLFGALLSLAALTFAAINYNLFIPPKTTPTPTKKIAKKAPEKPFWEGNTAWADSVLKTLTPEERIAQLFMVAAFSNKGAEHEAFISGLVKNQKIGGLCFFQGGPARQAKLTNKYQALAKVPLMLTIDGEWGLSMRLDSTPRYPRQMMLGAIKNDSLIYQMGADIARQCKRIGLHANFSPVADVNNNPNNPVINTRSFGENKYNVAKKAIAYMLGLQDNKVLATAKHFPGHGDTDSDSHKALPLISHNRTRLDSLELYPFKMMIEAGVGSIMVAHLQVPALGTEENSATTLSPKVVNGLLKTEMGFKGLIFTDALNMKGVSATNAPGYVDVKALLAGNDVLLYAEDVPTAIREIKKAVAEGKITQAEIDARCHKILMAKKWARLDKWKPLDLKNLNADLNTPKTDALNFKLAEAATTLAINNDSLVPLKRLDTLRIAAVAVDGDKDNVFCQTLRKYAKVDCFEVTEEAAPASADLVKKLSKYNVVIVGLHNPKNQFGKSAVLSSGAAGFISQLEKTSKTISVVFGNPYSLSRFKVGANTGAVIAAYEDTRFTQSMAAQAIFGGISVSGTLPVTASPSFKAGQGVETGKAIRLKYTMPEDVGMNSKDLNKIDVLANDYIKQGVFPGCVVLVAKDGNVIYNKGFGRHTYSATAEPTTPDDIFDLASITKIMASTVALMKLTDDGKFDLTKTLGDYLPYLKGTNKADMKVLDILTHQARLKAWIPFFRRTLNDDGTYKPGIYSTTAQGDFTVPVAENLYITKAYRDSIYKAIIDSPLEPTAEYKYSDMGYYLLKQHIEIAAGKTLDQFLADTYYTPLGLETMGYNPWKTFPKSRLIPTENDKTFRKQVIQGYVHDQGAAMLGGVAGHAGLFATANDLAIMLQMLLNYGNYGGVQYVSKNTVKEFTRCPFCKISNRRGIGFDKKQLGEEGPACLCVSGESYGHQGFTGTQVWADPVHNLVYVFLSNRVYPDAENKKISTLGVRQKIQEVIYDALPN